MSKSIYEDDHLYDLWRETQLDKRHDEELRRHHDCRDPDHPGCKNCDEEFSDYEDDEDD